jgi:hypothetical protein
MRVEASNSKLRPKSPMHNGGPMVSSDLTFLTIGVDLTFLTIGVKFKHPAVVSGYLFTRYA